jgi:hypothetical protein
LKPSCSASAVALQRRAAFALQQLFDQLTAARDGLRLGLGVEPGAHLGPCAVAGQVAQFGVEPVQRRPALLGGHHLHRLARLQRRVQRHHRAVHARAAAAVAQVGVQAVGKVHRRAARRQFDHVAWGVKT